MSFSKHKYIFIVTQDCEVCGAIINQVTEVDAKVISTLVSETCVNVNGVQIAACGKTHSVACPSCWELIKNG